MTAADLRRLNVLRRINDVFSDRLYDNLQDSRSVKTETTWLAARGLIEPYVDEDGGQRYRITDAGRNQLDVWEATT